MDIDNLKDMSPEYLQKAKHIWKTYVPKSGQADTVQGELLRAVEKLRDEATRNGNINWDEGHEILAHYLDTTLTGSGLFSAEVNARIKEIINRFYDFETPCTDNELYDWLTLRVVDWCDAHPEPVVHEKNPDLWR